MSVVASHSVQGVILAGTHPWDASSLDNDMPRPLIPVAHWPLICYSLRWLSAGGVSRATICANSASRAVRSFLADGSFVGLELNYYEDRTPRGPAGCARDAALDCDADSLVVIDATIIPRLDLCHLVSTHRESGASLTVVVHAEAVGGSAGAEELVPVGVYVFSRDVLSMVRETGYQDIKEVLIPQLRRDNQHVGLYRTDEACPRITDAATYLAVNEWMMTDVGATPAHLLDYRRVGDSYVHRSAHVPSSARLVGPVLIGPATRVGRDVTIVGPTSIGGQCRIEDLAVVCRSVVWDRCTVGKGGVVDGCIMTNCAAVGSGVRLYGRIVKMPAWRSRHSLLDRLFSRWRGDQAEEVVEAESGRQVGWLGSEQIESGNVWARPTLPS